MDELSPHFNWLLLLIGVSILLHLFTKRTGSPCLAIFSRWLRWVTLSLCFAYFILSLGWSGRPFWLLSTTIFLGWFILETLFNWITISALSRSDFPLFPRFRENTTGQEWPMQNRLFLLRDWLRENGFKKKAALQADLPGDIEIKCSIFESPDLLIRATIQFIPTQRGIFTATYSLVSQTAAGTRVVTDNSFIPFGGFYPENFFVWRKPLVRDFKKLLAIHRQRLAGFSDEKIIPWDNDPLDEINHQQQILEQTNTELGFLFPYDKREEFGRITWEGRYRVWKEIWLMNYLGLSRRY